MSKAEDKGKGWEVKRNANVMYHQDVLDKQDGLSLNFSFWNYLGRDRKLQTSWELAADLKFPEKSDKYL